MRIKNVIDFGSKKLNYVRLVVIAPARIDLYKKVIEEEISEKISYVYRYIAAIDLIKMSSQTNFKICIPDTFFDSSNRANDFAAQVKKINKNNKIYCYSQITPLKTKNLDGFVSDYEEEKEVDIIIGLLR